MCELFTIGQKLAITNNSTTLNMTIDVKVNGRKYEDTDAIILMKLNNDEDVLWN
jgi:hypothetical protein